jgi:hypothetical protein
MLIRQPRHCYDRQDQRDGYRLESKESSTPLRALTIEGSRKRFFSTISGLLGVESSHVSKSSVRIAVLYNRLLHWNGH